MGRIEPTRGHDRQAIQALLESRLAYLYRLRYVSDGLEVDWLNNQARDLIGELADSTTRPVPFSRLVHPADVDVVLESQRLLESKGRVEREYRLLTRDRKWIWVFDSAEMVWGDRGMPATVVGGWLNISRQKELESKIEGLVSQIREARGQMLAAEEGERRRISRDLHDDVGQLLTGLGLVLASASREAGNTQVRDRIVESQGLVREIADRVRSFSSALRPSILDDFGLWPALTSLVERIGRQSGLTITLHETSCGRYSRELETAAYRVAQEALNNVVRHAKAGRVDVRLLADDRGIELMITDDGRGFDPDRIGANSSGLEGMRERIRRLQGELSLEAHPGRGTRISAWLPGLRAVRV